MTIISAVVNLHREGDMARTAFASAIQNVAGLRQQGVSAEVLVVLDRPDAATRRTIEDLSQSHDFSIQEVSYGDLSLSRNHAVQVSKAEFIGFLDGDDLWCEDWLPKCYAFCGKIERNSICHPAWNVVFGAKQMLFPQPDQTERRLSLESLRSTNYWTALSFARRSIYETHPYHRNRIEEGFGYEDWAWNCETIEHGYLHRVVPETTHFIRYKHSDSLRDQTNANACLRTPFDLYASPTDLAAQK